jgi:hypothetical protein
MKLLIAGGRDFNDRAAMMTALQTLFEAGHIDPSVELICGMARGADMLGHQIFKDAALPIHVFQPDWNGLGKRAGFVRNEQMGDVADLALIFWDGQSKGTKHMIDYMRKLNKPAHIYHY